MTPHDPEHEAWIEAFALNERERIPARLLAALERCPTCAERRSELADAQRALDNLGAQMREDLRAAQTLPPLPDELERVRRWAGAPGPSRAGAGPGRARSGPRPLAWIAALAALLAVFAAGYFLSRSTPTPRGDEHLGSTRIRGQVAVVDAQRVVCIWQADALGDETHKVEVRYRDAQGRPHEFASDMLFEPRWEFEASRVAQAAGSFEWRVSLCSPARSTPESSGWVLQPLPAR